VDPEEREFGWFAGRAFEVLDWVPQRVTAFVFAIVGDFETPCSAGARRPRSGCAGGGHRPRERRRRPGRAAGRRPRAGRGARRTAGAGNGDPAGEDALASLEGMLWRSLVLWFVAYLLVASLSFS